MALSVRSQRGLEKKKKEAADEEEEEEKLVAEIAFRRCRVCVF